MKESIASALLSLAAGIFIGGPALGQTASVTYPSASAVTPPLAQLPDGPKPTGNVPRPHHSVPSHVGNGGQDTVVQSTVSALSSTAAGFNFDGPGANGYAPSDNNIAVGPNHIFAAVNSEY